MKTNIIVPIDFSNSSKIAFKWAQKIALTLGSNIKLCHMIIPTYTPGNPLIMLPTNEIVKVELDVMNSFIEDNLTIEFKSQNDCIVKPHISIDFPGESIVSESKNPDTEIIILGKNGNKNSLEKFLGSVSSYVSLNAKCPVLLVSNSPDISTENILFAIDKIDDIKIIKEKLLILDSLFHATIHFVHISESTNSSKLFIDNIITDIFGNTSPDFAFQVSVLENKSTVEGINRYASENNIDMIVLFNKQRGFWKKLFKSSITEELALQSNLPLLIYHISK